MTAADRDDALRSLEHEVGVLIRRIRRVIGERARAVHPDLQPSSYLVLGYLRQHAPARASELRTAFDMDKGAISRQVQHLLDHGLIERTPDPDDGRATLLTVSEEGLRRMADVEQHRRKLLDERLGEWTAGELADFAADLARYNASLNQPQPD